MDVLMIVDPQNDFIDGSLAVDGAVDAMNSLVGYVKAHGDDYDKIIITKDWHPQDHCSFNIWPKHCVQFSEGAEVYAPLIEALKGIETESIVLHKGNLQEAEEYSIFKNDSSRDYLTNTLKEGDDVDVCGIALDYCVKNTVLDMHSMCPNVNIRLIKEFCPCIGDADATVSELKENNIEIVE